MNLEESEFVFDHLVYLRVFEGCNVFCEHCFIPNNPKQIQLNFFEKNNLGDVLINDGNVPINKKIYLQWHGGEPTLLGPDYIRQAINLIEKDNRFTWSHGIQTNLINFSENTDSWINLYQEKFNSSIGVSWDYQIRHLKKGNLSLKESNLLYEELFWKNLKLLQEKNIDIYLVVTATKIFFNHFKNPFSFFELMVEKGIKRLNLERITNTGFARDFWDKVGLNNLEYSQSMAKFFKYYHQYKKNNPEIDLHISPFDGLKSSVEGLINKNFDKKHKDKDFLNFSNQGYGCWSGSCDHTFHTIDANGYKKGCTAINSETDNKNKTLTNKKIFWINSSIKDLREKRQETCSSCEYLSICSSGCLTTEKFDSSNECSGGKQLFNKIKEIVNLEKKNGTN